jgi:hypothetical protein
MPQIKLLEAVSFYGTCYLPSGRRAGQAQSKHLFNEKKAIPLLQSPTAAAMHIYYYFIHI